MTCHNPHGSVHNRLLNESAPNLCQDCHDGSRHPGTVYGAAGGYNCRPAIRRRQRWRQGVPELPAEPDRTAQLGREQPPRGARLPQLPQRHPRLERAGQSRQVLHAIRPETNMSKKLLSTLIASLFAAAPAFAQSDDDPMRVQGTATLGGIYNNTDARDTAKLVEYQDLGNGALSNVGVRAATAGPGSRATARISAAPTSTCSCAAACTTCSRPGRTSTTSRTLLVERLDAVRRQRRQRPDGDLPAGGAAANPAGGQWNSSGWATTGATRAASGSGRRTARGTSGSTATRSRSAAPRSAPAANGTSPGNGYTDLRFPTTRKTSNWGVEGGYQTGKATFALRWDYSKFENDNSTCSGRTRSSAATSSTRPTSRRKTRSTSSRCRATTVTCRGGGDLGALHVGEDNERRRRSALTALNTGGVYNATLPDVEQFQRREHQPVVRAGVDRARPSRTSTRASTTTGRSCRTNPR